MALGRITLESQFCRENVLILSFCTQRFLIYINDIVRNINSSIRLFADDTSFYIIVQNPTQAATILNSDLSQIYTWASNWLVTFNPSKTESLLFSCKLFKPLHPTLYMNQQDIITVESHKHLSLTFTMTFHGRNT